MDLGVKGSRRPKILFGCKTVCWFCYISLYVENCRLKILKAVSNKRRMISQDLKKKGRTSLLRYITDKVSTWSVDYPCFHNINYWEYFCSRAVFNCVPKVIRDWFQLIFLYFALWLVQKTRASLSQSIICKIKTNHVLVARVFSVGFTLSSHWLLTVFSVLPIGYCDNFGFINFQIEAGGGAETVIEQLKQEKVHSVHVHWYHFHDC